MCAKIIARYHTLQEHIYRVQNSPRVAARVWSQGARVWDVTLAADGLVHPAPFDNRFIGPNGLSMRPMGMRLIDHVNLLTKPGRFPYIMCIEKGTKLPPELTLLHERGDHFSLQTTQAVTPAVLNHRLSQFLHTVKTVKVVSRDEWTAERKAFLGH